MTILKRAGLTKEDAARLVSRLVPNRDAYLFNNKTPRHEQVTQWRRDAMEKRHPDVTRHYRDIVAGVKAAGLDPEQAAKKLLNP